MSTHKFRVGQAVEFLSGRAYAPRGVYEVAACLPERDGEFEYRIKHPAEEHQRIAREGELRAVTDAGEATAQIGPAARGRGFGCSDTRTFKKLAPTVLFVHVGASRERVRRVDEQ